MKTHRTFKAPPHGSQAQCAGRLAASTGESTRGNQRESKTQYPAFSSSSAVRLSQFNLNGRDEKLCLPLDRCPKRCYQPPEMEQGKKLWGSFIQLYSLKSEHNWGIGDFGDLKQFLRHIAATGADFVGLNPIHALFPANPESASPYSPSSRKWLNILYIDLNTLPEFQQNPEAQQWFQQPQIQQTLEKLRTASHIHYTEVMALKLEGLRLAFSFFPATGKFCSPS